jgi:hypothetical protein
MARIAHDQVDVAEDVERGGERLTETARSASEQGAGAARETMERARTSVTQVAEEQRQAIQQSAGEAAELGRVFVDLLGQQTRHNMQVAAAFGRAVNWAEVAEIQRDFIAGNFERMNQLGERYRAMVQAGMKSMTLPARH